jgi:tRNA(Ile)-lysidine synthase
VDHGLRPEAASEAAFASEICARLGCAHTILPVQVETGGEGLQGEARRARYAALGAWAEGHSIAILCTAHHADDQAETILMRLQRGSGIAGLSGIRAVRKQGRKLRTARPLLGWARSDLAAIVQAAGLAAVDDPSNRDLRFDRVAMRKFLAENPQFEPNRLSRSASALAEADEALAWTVERLAGERCTLLHGEWRIDSADLPREFKRRLLHRAIAQIRRSHDLTPDWTGAEDVEGLLVSLEGKETATRAGVIANASGDTWHIRLAPPRRAPA